MQDPIKIRIVFMGTSGFAATILEKIIDSKHNIVSVYTRPDKKTGRNQSLQKSAVKISAEKNGLKIYEPEKFDTETIKKLQEQKPDLLVVAAYGKILAKEVLDIPGFGALNVHASLLPKFRGPSPIQNAILEGETETGTTIMLMNEGIDTGDILSQKKISIGPDETTPELTQRLSELSSDLLVETIPLWVERKIKPQKQDDQKATHCQLIERSDGKIIWSKEAFSIYNRYRAFFPWPGIFTFWEKDGFNLRLKLTKISLDTKNAPNQKKIGEVFQDDGKIAVQTSNGTVILEEVQLEGKSKSRIENFINGYPDFIGSALK